MRYQGAAQLPSARPPNRMAGVSVLGVEQRVDVRQADPDALPDADRRECAGGDLAADGFRADGEKRGGGRDITKRLNVRHWVPGVVVNPSVACVHRRPL